MRQVAFESKVADASSWGAAGILPVAFPVQPVARSVTVTVWLPAIRLVAVGVVWPLSQE